MSQGLRTVCPVCAEVIDEINQGKTLRWVAYAAMFFFSLWIGTQIISSHEKGLASGVIGFAFLFGIPAIVLSNIIESSVKSSARRLIESKYLPAIPKESIASKIDDISWNGETPFVEWLDSLSSSAQPELVESLVSNAKFLCPHVSPLPGEKLIEWTARAKKQINQWSAIDPRSKESSIQSNESVNEWAHRVIPSIIPPPKIGFAELFKAIIPFAENNPPEDGETALDWSERHKAEIERHFS